MKRKPGELTAAVVELHRKGMSVSDIAKQLGVTYQAVSGCIGRMGKLRTNKSRREAVEERKDQVLELHQRGLINIQIAERLGMAKSTVSRMLRDMQLSANREAPRVEKEVVYTLWDGGASVAKIAELVHCNHSWIKAVLRERPPKQKAPAAPKKPKIERPAHPFWTTERDAMLAQAKNLAEVTEIAHRLGRTIADTQARWHRIRVGA